MDTYTISPADQGGFVVQIKYGAGGTGHSPHFPTEAEAGAWVGEQQKLAAVAEQWERRSPGYAVRD